MKKFILAFMLPLLIGCGNNETEIQSKWNDSLIVADGNPADWKNFSMDYFKESGVAVGMKNDKENLYVLLRFKDEPLTRFLQSKITFWLDKTGKKKKTFGISYMGKMPPRHMPGQENFYQNPPEEEQGFKKHPEMQDIMIIQKEESMEKSIPIPPNGKQGPSMARNYDRGFCYHELKIPLQKNDSVMYAIDTYAGDTISVGVELGIGREKQMGRDMPGNPPESGMPDDEMSGNMPPRGGMGGPGMRRDGPSGMPGEKGQIPGKKEIWLKIILAAEPKENK